MWVLIHDCPAGIVEVAIVLYLIIQAAILDNDLDLLRLGEGRVHICSVNRCSELEIVNLPGVIDVQRIIRVDLIAEQASGVDWRLSVDPSHKSAATIKILQV